jgi:hypothetical protein
MEVYMAVFDRNLESVHAVHARILEEGFDLSGLGITGIVVICGDGAMKAQALLSGNPQVIMAPEVLCSARHLIRPALKRWEAGQFVDPLLYIPDYLKPPNITQAKSRI